MNNNVNLQSELFRQNLVNLINSANLPIGNIYFIFQLIGKDLENAYNEILNKEKEQVISNFNENKEQIMNDFNEKSINDQEKQLQETNE